MLATVVHACGARAVPLTRHVRVVVPGNLTWDDTTAFLDRCAAVGMRVLFDFSQNAMLPPMCTSNHTAPGTGAYERCTALGLPTDPPPLDVIRTAVESWTANLVFELDLRRACRCNAARR